MSKNAIIGLLVAIVVIGGGYLLLKNKPVTPVVNQTSTSTTTTTPGTTTTTPPGTVTTAGAPIVLTSGNTGPSSTAAIVTGQVNPNGASTTYWFDYGPTTAFGTRTVDQSVGSGYTLIAAPAYITGLRANTLYYFRLSAKNRFGTVAGATYTFSTNNTPPPQALAPTTRTTAASSISRTSANLNGQVNPNGSSTTYWFEYGKDNDMSFGTALQSAGNGSSSLPISVSVSGLEPLTKYYFRMTAQNQYGTVNGAIVSFTTTGPAAPSEPSVTTSSATSIATTSAQLNGRVNPNGGETTYWFEYSEDSLLGTLIGTGTPQQVLASGTDSMKVQANITSLRSNTKYFYRLVARNSYGTVRGDIVSFRTK